MITIDDNDLPITVAQKIITGTRPNDNPIAKGMAGLAPDVFCTEDMFSCDELKEIAFYLLVYYREHENGD